MKSNFRNALKKWIALAEFGNKQKIPIEDLFHHTFRTPHPKTNNCEIRKFGVTSRIAISKGIIPIQIPIANSCSPLLCALYQAPEAKGILPEISPSPTKNNPPALSKHYILLFLISSIPQQFQA
jgi:hypothetical protein